METLADDPVVDVPEMIAARARLPVANTNAARMLETSKRYGRVDTIKSKETCLLIPQ